MKGKRMKLLIDSETKDQKIKISDIFSKRLLFVWQPPAIWLLFMTLSYFQVAYAIGILLSFLVYINIGLFTWSRYNYPERPVSAWLKWGVILPTFVWQVTCGIAFFPTLILGLFQVTSLLLTEPIKTIAEQQLVLGGITIGVISFLIGNYSCLIRPQIVRQTKIQIAINALPASFEGYKIVQLSDLHIGNFHSVKALRRWVKKSNALDADLIVLTGDFLNSGTAYLKKILQELKHLQATDGIIACLGNHDYYTNTNELVEGLLKEGILLLRNDSISIQKGNTHIYIAGVDDTWKKLDDIDKALENCLKGAPIILLAHDPVLFRQAVERGVDLTLSGHTHGGQIAIPGKRRLNLSSFIHEYTAGLYIQEQSSLYLHSGLGTTGAPIRFGVPPEIATFTLTRKR